jgi:hypothetical protein
MILISLTPFSPKRLLVVLIAAICLSCISCFAQPILLPVKSTPYDNQMSRIRPILETAARGQGAQVSLNLVNHWIEDLRAIPYAFSQQWKTPVEVEGGAVADCKGKAIALYQKMQACGASNVRLVIGRRCSISRSTHTWLEWSTANGTYVLDPTINWMAWKANQMGGGTYIPLYAYAGNRKYRATPATLLAKN